MKRFLFLSICGMLAHLLSPFGHDSVLYATALGTGNDRPPNIILILADDLGYGDVSSYNPSPLGNISTPHIDQLARRGMTFTDAHSTSSVCTPSRYSILTGIYYLILCISQRFVRSPFMISICSQPLHRAVQLANTPKGGCIGRLRHSPHQYRKIHSCKHREKSRIYHSLCRKMVSSTQPR